MEDAEKVQEQNAKEEFSKVFKVWNQYIFNQNINSVKESDSNKKSFLITRDYSIRFLSKKGFSVNELNQFSNEQLFLKAIDEHSK
ncbi:hypothetical protein [Haloflavibacter putidus]|uniref:Uncharacterized protein n=1 Tax=Haloflavibacter putidus TaxID=2576776 RepID=A0A507ZP75_9FLAO|nr:hypothetical protein [Haloflavibacter putidus]TQD39340.1 hypothetical protein FKR84_05450 [Haloflavibacter putidus]